MVIINCFMKENKQILTLIFNLDQIDSWCINFSQFINRKLHYTRKQQIMHASNWKKKPLEMLKTGRVRNLNFPGKICKILNEAGRD